VHVVIAVLHTRTIWHTDKHRERKEHDRFVSNKRVVSRFAMMYVCVRVVSMRSCRNDVEQRTSFRVRKVTAIKHWKCMFTRFLLAEVKQTING